MTTFILIIFAHVGIMGDGNSNALTNVPGFTTEAACVKAGNKVTTMSKGTVKEISFVCVSNG